MGVLGIPEGMSLRRADLCTVAKPVGKKVPQAYRLAN